MALGKALATALALALAVLGSLSPGAQAGDCKGQRQVLREAPGFVTDGAGNYSVNGNCEWLIEAPSPQHQILLDFLFLDTECTYDYLFVYDGDSPRGPLLASLSGSTRPPPIEASSGKMLLHLFSDANYNLLGFNASFRFSLCPGGCRSHGQCQPPGVCACEPGWGGPDCGVQECSAYCGSHGTCASPLGPCRCEPGFLGRACDLHLWENQGAGWWHNVSAGDPAFSARIGAAGAFLSPPGLLAVFGGQDLNNALGDLVLYNFSANTWESWDLSPAPAARHSHVAVAWAGSLVLMGGELADGSLINDVWAFSPLGRGHWELLAPPASSSSGPPGLAGHAAALVDDVWLYVSGGRTQHDLFSSGLFRFRLDSTSGGYWEQVIPAGGRPPAATGHSMVFHAPSRALLVHGGHRPSTARFSVRVNSTELFHVDRRVWTTLKGRDGLQGPRERAFHTASVLGNYMVVYGGNVHTHYQEEKCYEDGIFFYHLGCHQWVSGAELAPPGTPEGRAAPPSGRYSHVAAVLGGSVLLVAGGYSGRPRGDLMAYKVPPFVFQAPAPDYHLDYCSMYTDHSVCSRDPECSWCQGACQAAPPPGTPLGACPAASCLGLGRLLGDCQACLAFSSPTAPPRGPGTLGWCVHNESCLPRPEQARCRGEQISGTVGWWGPAPVFVTSLEACVTQSFLPGLHLLTFQQPPNTSQPDKVSIVRSTTITLTPSAETDVSLVYRGFIYPMLPGGPGGPGSEDVAVWARAQRLHVLARMARGPDTENMEEVGRWVAHQEKETRQLQRPGSARLFPLPGRDHKYAVEIRGQLNGSAGPGHSELTLLWDRTGVPGGSEISFFFLEPYRSSACTSYSSCLGCLADQGCGWCLTSASCHLRQGGAHCGDDRAGGSLLVLVPTLCPLCEEHRDCHACTQDPFCEWHQSTSRKGDAACSRRGRGRGAIKSPDECPPLCNQRLTCEDCLANSSQCAWCQSTHTCFLFAAYLARYPHGGCRGWDDSVHSEPRCRSCDGFLTCHECLQSHECGWCGNEDNPTLGRCLQGDFSGPLGGGNCSLWVGEGLGLPVALPARWAYARCPDVDECRLGLARCHPRATCLNTPLSYECHCQRGYQGDGISHCNRTCLEDCGHGVCSGPPDFTCVCDLGWTSDLPLPTPAPGPPAPRCSRDCGCSFHSHCRKRGPGFCDECQDWTWGEHCERCRPGSFGNATGSRGCRPCQCNGHGDPRRGHCDNLSGLCFCQDHTEGAHCQLCSPGYYGDPRAGGSCFRECGGRALLTNVSSVALGSRRVGGLLPPGGGAARAGPGLSYCVWVVSATEELQPCAPGTLCPPLTLTFSPDSSTPCTLSYVLAFDGFPRFLDTGVVQSDRSLIAAFCGQRRDRPLTVQALSGLLVLHWEANGSSSWGFNASVGSARCGSGGPGSCPVPQECVPQDGAAGAGLCRCPQGWAGPHCRMALCPENCNAHTGAGTCNQSLGVCICAEGFGGPDCATKLDGGQLVWETLMDSRLSADTASRFLHRLGHTMVEGPDATLWMFGGLGLPQGLLGNLYRYSVSERRWTQMLAGAEDGGPGPSPRSFHAAAYVPAGRGAMYLLGGLTAGGVTRDFWVLNLTTLQWRQEKAPQTVELPAVAGHTLTARRGLSLLLVGGYSPENGFNQQLLEYQLATGTWVSGAQSGTPPTGLYGHSAVYHEATDSLYVFGGFRFHVELAAPSPELYSLHCPDRTWSLLAPSQGAKPRPRLFHASALLGDTMVVLGGRSDPDEFSSDVLLYQVNCNAWLLPDLTRPASVGPPVEESVAHAVAAVGGRLYISGGFGGVALGRLLALTLPPDPCRLLSSPEACNQSGACTWCHGACLSGDQAHRLGCGGSPCSPMPRSPEECRRLRTCSECLARHPRTLQPGDGEASAPRCKWCTNCPEGACIGRNGSCTSENDCRINQREVFWAGNCSEAACGAADCEQCTREGKCMWTRQFKRTGETRRILSVQPTYDWTCFSHSLLNVSPMPVESSPPLPCPTPCHLLPNCTSCLDSKGADGGWQHCVWSSSLQQCLSPSYLPLRCMAGGCGRLLRGPESCSLGCAQATQCASCLRRPHCGWCAWGGQDGGGRCMEGGLSGPRDGLTCGRPGASWAFLSCPPEDECANGHHDCNETQNCHDQPHGYECSCKTGYTMDNVTGLCRPVCAQGCVNGSCVEPDHCRCHFGFVGRNCSTECRCNRHSECAGVGARDHCLLCRNHTKGSHCEQCLPLFVGSAVGGGTCRPCHTFCRGNSHVCISKKEFEMAKGEPQKYSLDPEEIENWVTEGPSEDEAMCVNCQNNSYGEKCESCLQGYFLLDGKCTKCQCNGHADTCNEQDGTGCPCQNNTETGTCQGSSPSDRRDCYKYQCAKCRESFHGNPLGGQQCYRLISVEQECCLDPTSQTNCFHEPKRRALGPGRTVLFGVQPKFTNVDIRLTLDVTFGAVDLYVSTSFDTFVVRVAPDTGVHTVHIQASQPPPPPPPLADGGPRGAGDPGGAGASSGPGAPAEPRVREVWPQGLITYVTVTEPSAVLVVHSVRDRLVITYPHEHHALKSSRFYLLLLGVGDPSGPGTNGSADSQGLLFFRQDQAHIDLFVFFSVFFSCFFLFLSLCVLLWKAKQALDQRQEQRRHLQEMTKMASRPFAKVTVCFPPDPTALAPAWKPAGLPPPAFRRSEPFLAPLLLTGAGGPWGPMGGGCCPPAIPATTAGLRAGPITLEPTEDGMAGVATLLLQLPGGPHAPNGACLGSALVTLRHRLHEYCGGGGVAGGSGHGAGVGRKGLLSQDNLTSMSL
ncbi:multiple epidermal growth factor-like domains protein 8 isoform X1 [Macaca nemestrina]|uniref:multiple epidermal growth factor-like domains protein 8 isoform X1 n=1 Tax=Macaca nemestrina TaxID=9545 RepID=UPI0021BCC227|nr:multiple epidermal growth factor-like domains protein 8 isoform X2 [Macaca thibetana thibetana]